MCCAPSPGAAESQARVWSHAPLQVGCAAVWAEAGVGRGSKGEEDVSYYCAFEDGVFIRRGEKFLPKVGASAHPGAGEKGAAGFFGEDDGGDTVAHAAKLAA